MLVDVRPDMEIVQRETFGPVMTIQRACTARKAVRLANA